MNFNMLRKIIFIAFIFAIALSACDFDNRAIRGGPVVDKYNIAETNLPVEEVRYKNIDGSMLYAWYIKKPNQRQLPTIIFLHGSRGNLSNYLPVIRNLYQNIDADIFACDFPGTGGSKGKMSLESSYQMTVAAIDYLTEERKLSREDIVLYGTSMGASLAFYGASKREKVLIIVDSGVTSASDYMRRYTLFGLPDAVISLFGENFNNYDLARDLKNPKLFLHGKEDRIIDIKYARKLYEQAAEPKDFSWVEGGHVLFWKAETAKELSKKVREFIGAYSSKTFSQRNFLIGSAIRNSKPIHTPALP